MTRIGAAEQVLLLLRARLQNVARARRERGGAAASRPRKLTPAERARGLAAAEYLSEDERERVLISGLLTEEFGDAVSNEAQFQTMCDDVLAIIRRDERAKKLLKSALADLEPD